MHSPFVYKLIDECIYHELDKSAFHENLMRQLTGIKKEVRGQDFGSENSQVERSYLVFDLARRSALKWFELKLLYNMIIHHHPSSFLELGTNLGVTSLCLSKQNPALKITTVEGNVGLADFAKAQFNFHRANKIELIHSSFDSFFECSATYSHDMIFLDGDHREVPTLKYYEKCKSVLSGEGPLILHDIYWSKGMKSAWKKIIRDPSATVTIDLYFFGLVYFRKGQKKEHFSIRFPRSIFQIL